MRISGKELLNNMKEKENCFSAGKTRFTPESNRRHNQTYLLVSSPCVVALTGLLPVTSSLHAVALIGRLLVTSSVGRRGGLGPTAATHTPRPPARPHCTLFVALSLFFHCFSPPPLPFVPTGPPHISGALRLPYLTRTWITVNSLSWSSMHSPPRENSGSF